MTNKLKKHCKRILKQYGKHIKAFENRPLEPSKDTENFRKKYAKDRISINPIMVDIGSKQKSKLRMGLNLYNNMPLISILHSRYGFESRSDKNKINCYNDIVELAK